MSRDRFMVLEVVLEVFTSFYEVLVAYARHFMGCLGCVCARVCIYMYIDQCVSVCVYIYVLVYIQRSKQVGKLF